MKQGMRGTRLAQTRRRIALAVSAVMVGTLLQGALTSTAAAVDDLPKIPSSERPLTGHRVKMSPRKADGKPRLPKAAPKRAWPKPGSATVTLPAPAGAKSSAVAAGSLPISLGTPRSKARGGKHEPFTGEATVRLLDRAASRRADVEGPVFTLTPGVAAAGDAVEVAVDYSAYAQSFGGSYARRLQLVELPACFVTTPELTRCSAPRTVAAGNDPKTQTLTAQSVSLPTGGGATAAPEPVILAVTAAASGDKGDYSASPLSASATWQTSLSTGDFSWSYNMAVPSVPGSFEPNVKLDYSSGGVDGRTSNTNNQGSWVGDGFNLWSGSIERAYKPCADDGVTAKPGDLCWGYDNASISFNGHAGELIATGKDTFRIKGDDGTKVDRIYGDSSNVRANGAHDDEYWRVTTTDGTRYYFGYNRLPGWASGKETTDSTWTVPVFGDDVDEPCHGATFADSWCQQAWRWNLDYAVDVHGNALAYYYDTEGNYYARNVTPADETYYDRGGSLDRIEYGLKSSAMYAAKPLAKVNFTSKERCLPQSGVTCDAATIDDQSFYWYDTPWDMNCKSGADCLFAAPTFWTRKRLTGVATEVLKVDGTYTPVDSWALEHQWGMADIDYQLELAWIQHTGKADTPTSTTDISQPKVTFGYDQRANRLDIPNDDTAPFIKERLATIDDESGGQIDVTYSTAVCDAAHLPTPATNATRCFPQYFTQAGSEELSLQWFNKYVVDSVTQTDRTNTAPDMVTRYSYLDGAAWHFDDDDGLTKQKYKTWSTYRGYGHVRVQTGGQDPVGMKSQAEHYFLRGMDGDKTATDGVTKQVSVSDDNGGTITDHSSAEGYEYKNETYDKPGGVVLSKSINTPWHHETATRSRSWGTTTANLSGTLNTWGWISLDDGAGTSWRKTYTSYSHENVAGRITQVHEAGDTSTAADNRCTRTTYAENTPDWILTPVARTETVAVACATTPDRSKDVLSDTRTAFDGLAYGAAPTTGEATRIATLKSHDGTTATYLESGLGYDGYGRQISATDLTGTVTASETTTPVRTDRSDGRTATTAYSPTTGFATLVTTTSPPATAGNTASAQTTKTTLEAIRGLPVTVEDANTKRTETAYDALGRKLRVWLPNRSKATDTPNYDYSYTQVTDKPVAVGTTTLAGTGRQTTYTLFDGFLRPRQVQAPGPGGGMLVADTFYDERGLTAKAFAPYYTAQAPSTALFALDDALYVETQTWNSYDGLGRNTKTQQVAGNGDGGQVLATTQTSYGGDRVTVTPPAGATATTTLTDARGQNTELWQYHGSTPTGTPDKTLYHYTPAGKLDQVTDPAGNEWRYAYDQHGNQTNATDPDTGTTVSAFNDRNELITTTAQGDTTATTDDKKITRLYDNLGREIETHDGTATGPLLTKRSWDPTGFKGQLASSTRYVGGDAYTVAYQLYDTLYRPHRTTTTIPATTANGALAGSYQSGVNYNADGTVQSQGYPAAGALPAEVLTPTYDEVLRPKTLSGSGGLDYITDTAYSYTGKPLQYTYQAAGAKLTQVTNSYEWGTQRLHNSRVDRQDVPGVDKSATFAYDQAGNITAIGDVSRDGTDNQCFDYDYLGRLTEAWTQPTTTCDATPTGSALGGPAPYWHSYGYDLVGNRTTETAHDPAGDPAKDIKRKYTYPAPKAARPHTLTQVETTSPSGTALDSYTYTPFGDTGTRTLGGDKQTLTWDTEGHLTKVSVPDGTGGTDTTDYVYDADGNRLITRTATKTTLQLADTELTLDNGATTPKATRYYDLGGGNQAIRTDDNKLSFLLGDHHGTSELAINATDLTMQQRRSTPFGAPRGKTPTNWPGTKGFIGGTQDTTTGLTHLGARDYDPTTGRFLSADPIVNHANPQQINGYAYANNNPTTTSDPTGLCAAVDCPTRPCPDCENTTPGHKPGPSKPAAAGEAKPTLTAAGEAKREERKWVKIWTPSTNDPDKLRDLFYTYGTWAEGGSGYWNTENGWGNACFGRDACTRAFNYLVEHPNDVAGAKKIAATYCVENYERCASSGRKSEAYRGITQQVGLELFGAMLARSRPCSFDPDTPVLMEDGKTKPIGTIKPGDKVEAASPETGKHEGPRKVAATFIHNDDDLIDLKIEGRDGRPAVLHTTADHPFWDDTTHSWISADKLTVGHNLNTATNGHARLIEVRVKPGAADMYNLTVADLHTYYVLAGRTPVLVHNSMEKCSDAAFQTVLHNEQEIIDGKSSHIIPGMDSRTPEGADALADYVDHVTSTPGTPLLNGGGEAWYDAERGLYIFRGGTPAVPSGSVFRAPPEYFTNKTGVQIKK